MHKIEPYFNWQDHYISENDERSPFFGNTYSEFEYSNKIYNYFIHPQWDFIGSETLYIKILYADYKHSFAIIELIGEWNDAINNDIMHLKRNVIDDLLHHGISKFILIGENILNFHGDDNCYYEEWFEDALDKNGWICMLNVRDHVYLELDDLQIPFLIFMGNKFNSINWRNLKPKHLFLTVEKLIPKLLTS